MTLQHLRKRIDRLDDRIVVLLNCRLALAQQIGDWKRRNGSRVQDRRREREILTRLSAGLRGPLTPRELRAIYRRILRVSRDHQKRA